MPPTWKPIRKVTRTNVTGGFSSKEWPVKTRSFKGRTFVEFNLADEWVCKMVTGKPPRSTAAGPTVPETTIIHHIVDQLKSHERAEAATPTKAETCDDLDSGFGTSPSSTASLAVAGSRASGRRARSAQTKPPKEKAEMEMAVTVPSLSADGPEKTLGILVVPGDAAKRTAKSYRAHVWLLLEDLDWALERLQEECFRASSSHSCVGPKDYPNMVYSPADRSWKLSWLKNSEVVTLSKHVQNYKRTYGSGRLQEPVREVLAPDEFLSKKSAAATELIRKAEAAGFEKPDGFEALWGVECA